MDAASVASALTIQPETPVDLAWAPDGTSLTIAPSGHWAVGVLHTVDGPGRARSPGRASRSPDRPVPSS